MNRSTIAALLATLILGLPSGGRAGEDRFQWAGMTEQEAQLFLASLQDALRSGDPARIADLVEWPLPVTSDDSSTNRSIDRAEFLSQPDSIFTPHIKETVLSQKLADVCVLSGGVSLADGVVVFSVRCDRDPVRCDGLRIRVVNVERDEMPKEPSPEQARAVRRLLARIERDHLFAEVPRKCMGLETEERTAEGFQLAVRFDPCTCPAEMGSTLIERFFVHDDGLIEWYDVPEARRRPYQEYLRRYPPTPAAKAKHR